MSADDEVASTAGLLLIKVYIDHETGCWKPVDPSANADPDSPPFGRVSLVIRQQDESYAVRFAGLLPDASYTELALSDVKDYVIKTRIWHELRSADGREMALYLSVGEGLSKFTKLMATALRAMGKYDRLQSPKDLINDDELVLQAQRILLLRTVSLKELDQPHQQQAAKQQQQQQQQNTDNKCRTLPTTFEPRRLDALTQRHGSQSSSAVFPTPRPRAPRPAAAAAAAAAAGTGHRHVSDSDPIYTSASDDYEYLIYDGRSPSAVDSRSHRAEAPQPPSPRAAAVVDPPFRDLAHEPPVIQHAKGVPVPVSSWACVRCRLDNVATSYRCENCLSIRPDAWQCPDLGKCKRRLNSVMQSTCGDCQAWKCKFCTSINFQSSVTCTVCNQR